jgi:hypothetical protein
VSVGPVVIIESWIKKELTQLELEAVLLHEDGYIRYMGGLTEMLTMTVGDTVDIYPKVVVNVENEIRIDAYALVNGANADALVSATYKLIRRLREKFGTGFYRRYKIYKSIYRARFDAIKPYCFTR